MSVSEVGRRGVTVRGSAGGLAALVVLSGCLGVAEAEREPAASSLPPIDRGAPARLATATFALG